MLDGMTGIEAEVVLEMITDAPEALEQHIRDGGTFASYVTAWRLDRDRSAAGAITPETARAILAEPLCERNRWGEGTVRDYLIELLVKLWLGEAGPKYGMVGSSDWEYDLYDPLYRMGLIPGWRDGEGVGRRTDGTDHPEDQDRARALIVAAIRALVTPSA